jgi:hypothetical protein
MPFLGSAFAYTVQYKYKYSKTTYPRSINEEDGKPVKSSKNITSQPWKRTLRQAQQSEQ